MVKEKRIMPLLGIEKYTYESKKIDLDECNRIGYELTIDDFSTSYVNPYRVGNLAKGVNNYLSYKKKWAND